MPANKYALIRYRVIDNCISNRFRAYPTKEYLRQACEEALYGSTGENISQSTIEKDIYAMRFDSALGYEAPIEYSKEHKGYYYSDPDYTIKKIPLKDEDIAAIQIAASTLFQFRDIGIFRQYQEAIAKILDAVTISNAHDEIWQNKVIFEDYPEYTGRDQLEPIFEAVHGNRVIEFDYQPFLGSQSHKNVHPYLLKQFKYRWYLIGFDSGDEKIKTFGLERMTNIKLKDKKFEVRSDFNADIYFKYSFGITRLDINPVLIEFEASALLSQYLKTRPIHPSMKVIQEKKDKTVFQLQLVITFELVQWMMSQGSQIKLLKPFELIDIIKKELAATRDFYK